MPIPRGNDHVWAATRKRYIEREKISVSEAEMFDLKKSVERSSAAVRGLPDDSPFPPQEYKWIGVAMARATLMDWKVSKSLYEQYGGRVGMGSLGAWIALDGQEALLREHHQAGDFKFHNAKLETAFWEYARRKQFADVYPKGEELTRLFATPPYLRADATARVAETKRERVGSALGQDIYRDQFKENPPSYHQVVQLFMAAAMEEFERKNLSKFEMTDPELRRIACDYWERPSHPGGFHTDLRLLMFPWTKEYQQMKHENEGPVPAKTR